MRTPETGGTTRPAGKRHNPGRKATDAFRVVGRLVPQLAQLAVFIVAARLLGPVEFGIFALASACAIVLLRATDAGWAPLIIPQPGVETGPLQVLLIAILSGTACGLSGGFGALAVGSLGRGQPEIIWAAGIGLAAAVAYGAAIAVLDPGIYRRMWPAIGATVRVGFRSVVRKPTPEVCPQ
ncbi:hypothetical protein [Oceaniovalibus sp. ACAM 378]|uniref:hypothetical protein n=1 Tax=Oceaniovalibus sp. ACAM 378 TaxID=2599923 RepID=UPI001652857B|nr:hypothetical protein [Oceaniovalibus sp. ACAM 378]